MSTENKPVQIIISLDSVLLNGKDQVACECRVQDGNDVFLNHTAAYLASKMQESAQRNIRDAMRYAQRQVSKSKQGIH